MIIDVHAHIGDLRTPELLDRAPISVERLLDRLDAEGIDMAVVLPWPPCPEAVEFPGLFDSTPDIVSQVRAATHYPDRLIPFGNADPRWGGNSARTDFSWLLERFIEMGCVGMGEVSANLYFDDPRVVNLFQQCGRWRLPVTIESTGPGEGHYGFIDKVGSPHLERLLQLAPETIVIGHGPGFWAEIDGDLSDAEKAGWPYPRGIIRTEGSLARLFRSYPHLYADISAMSGYNALTRDEDYGVRFLIEFQDQLMFGTDVCFGDTQGRTQHLGFLRGLLAAGRISQEVFDKLAYRNALIVLQRYQHVFNQGKKV